MEESVNAPRNVLLATILVILAASFSTASNIYVAQNAAGGNTGVDCADAHAAAWFNSSSNWGSAASQIGPGTTVHLCGTLNAPINAQGSGTSGSPIVIAFDCPSKGQISMPAIPATGAIILTGSSYITVDGQSCGVIQSTNNGTASSGYGNSVGSVAIAAMPGSSNIEVKNLTCGPLYIHTPPEVTSFGAPYPVCVAAFGTNFTIDNNTFHDCAWCVWGAVTANLSMYNNTIYNFDHGLGMGLAQASGIAGPVYFYNNNLSNATTWDTGSAGQYHHDGVHLWAYCADGTSFCPGTYWNNVYIYNNYFHGNWGPTNTTAQIFLEENHRNYWIFNNLADCSQSLCSSVFEVNSGTNMSVLNNTILANNTMQISANLLAAGPNLVVQNNVDSTSNQELNDIPETNIGGEATTISALSNNVYMNGGSNAFVWHTTFLSFSQFSTWEATSGEKASVSAPTSTLTAGLALQSGSPAIGAGANLYSMCSGQPNPGLGALCFDYNGNARPTSGPWDAGAISFNAGSQPAPPTGLAAVVQ